jgi:hypothetical protein
MFSGIFFRTSRASVSTLAIVADAEAAKSRNEGVLNGKCPKSAACGF